MPEYTCGDDKSKSAVQIKLEKCQSDVRQLQEEVQKVENMETSCSLSLEKTYFKQYIRTLLRHYSRSVRKTNLVQNLYSIQNSKHFVIFPT